AASRTRSCHDRLIQSTLCWFTSNELQSIFLSRPQFSDAPIDIVPAPAWAHAEPKASGFADTPFHVRADLRGLGRGRRCPVRWRNTFSAIVILHGLTLF